MVVGRIVRVSRWSGSSPYIMHHSKQCRSIVHKTPHRSIQSALPASIPVSLLLAFESQLPALFRCPSPSTCCHCPCLRLSLCLCHGDRPARVSLHSVRVISRDFLAISMLSLNHPWSPVNTLKVNVDVSKLVITLFLPKD
jgi:hypothetical protein